MAIEVYWGSGSPYSWRVMLACAVKGLAYESKMLSFTNREHKSPDYLALNPRGKVPTLVDGDTVVTESVAIMAYLERAYPKVPLFGTNPAEHGRIWQEINEHTEYGQPVILRTATRIFFGGVDAAMDSARSDMASVHIELERINERLTTSLWLASSGVSAADIIWFPAIQALLRAADKPAAAKVPNMNLLPLAQTYPSISRWVGQVEALDGYDATYPPHWR